VPRGRNAAAAGPPDRPACDGGDLSEIRPTAGRLGLVSSGR
jgi:hypothetical protein